MTATTIPPQAAPRDALDGTISLFVGLLQAAVLFGLPALAVHYFTGSTTLAIVASSALCLMFIARSVTNMEISPEGLRVNRMGAASNLIPWSAITSIEQASRTELIRDGWLWPLVFPREMTPTVTSLGHYRIQIGERWIYYPPKDAAAFQAAVRSYLTQSKLATRP